MWRIVRDYGVLMPTMVYNCAYMPAICKNVKKYSGYLPVAGQERTFHYDRDLNVAKARKRLTARRKAVYPDDWIKEPGRCPESDQPDWTGYLNEVGTKFGPYKALMLRKGVFASHITPIPLALPRNTPTKIETRPADSFHAVG